MNYCNPLEFQKSGYSLLKSKTIKPKHEQNTNTDFWEELLVASETFRSPHHSPCSTTKSNFKIDTLPLLVHCAADSPILSLETKIYQPHSHNFSSPQNKKLELLIFSATNPFVVALRDFCQAHHYPASNNNTCTPNRSKQHQCFNATKHQRISILKFSLSPCCWEQKLPTTNKKEKNPKLLVVHTQEPKAKNLLHYVFILKTSILRSL
jgi:hypothetical protein